MCRLSASRAPKPSEQGFTLIELMVALSIFSLAALALVRVQGMAVRNTADLQAREIASIVLQNRMADIVSAPTAPVLGDSNGAEQNGGVNWGWAQRTALTADPSVVQVQLTVTGPALRRPLAVKFFRPVDSRPVASVVPR